MASYFGRCVASFARCGDLARRGASVGQVQRLATRGAKLAKSGASSASFDQAWAFAQRLIRPSVAPSSASRAEVTAMFSCARSVLCGLRWAGRGALRGEGHVSDGLPRGTHPTPETTVEVPRGRFAKPHRGQLSHPAEASVSLPRSSPKNPLPGKTVEASCVSTWEPPRGHLSRPAMASATL